MPYTQEEAEDITRAIVGGSNFPIDKRAKIEYHLYHMLVETDLPISAALVHLFGISKGFSLKGTLPENMYHDKSFADRKYKEALAGVNAAALSVANAATSVTQLSVLPTVVASSSMAGGLSSSVSIISKSHAGGSAQLVRAQMPVTSSLPSKALPNALASSSPQLPIFSSEIRSFSTFSSLPSTSSVFSHHLSDADKEQYLADLAKPSLGTPEPLEIRVIGVNKDKMESWFLKGYSSREVGRMGNDGCVPAAFSTLIQDNKAVMELMRVNNFTINTDNGILKFVELLRLRKIEFSELLPALEKRMPCFIRANALYSNSYHAYCAFGSAGKGFAYAFDPDDEEYHKYKKVPLTFIDQKFIFTR